MKRLIGLLLFASPLIAQQINPTTQIQWNRLAGHGTPAANGFTCTSNSIGTATNAIQGEMYTDQDGPHYWTCAKPGGTAAWFQVDNAGNATIINVNGSPTVPVSPVNIVDSDTINWTLSGATISAIGLTVEKNDSTTGVNQKILNFDDTTPAAPAGNTNCTWQHDNATGRWSCYIPTTGLASLTTNWWGGYSQLQTGVLNIPADLGGNVFNSCPFSALIGAWADGSGQVLTPFCLDQTASGPVTLYAPISATQFLLGVNDVGGFHDNTGSWVVDANGTNYTVLGTTIPWVISGVNNARYTWGPGDSATYGTAPISIPAPAAGTALTISYVSGTISNAGACSGFPSPGPWTTAGQSDCRLMFSRVFPSQPSPGFWAMEPYQAGGGGGGTIDGSGTAGWYALWSASTTLGNGNLDDGVSTASVITAHEPFAVADGSGQGGTFDATEGTAPSAAAGHDILYADSTDHCFKVSFNGGGFTCIGAGSGSVSSVAQTVPSWLSVAGSPITTSGTLAITAATGQTSHQVLGTCGTATSFGPCALVAGDLPSIPLSGLATQAADTVVMNATGSTAVPTAVAMPTCTSGADLYNTSTHTWSCVSAGTGSVTDSSGTTTTPQVALSTTTLHQIQYSAALPNGITATTQTASDNSTKVATTAYVDTKPRQWSCQSGIYSGSAISAATYTVFDCVNDTGSTITLSAIHCYVDNASATSTVNMANNAGTGMLSGAITCNNTKTNGGASGTLTTTTLASGDALNFTFVADGTTKQSLWVVTGSY